jgi:hypothetical protein
MPPKGKKELPHDPDRPGRVELFCFYYLGFSPEGEYHFPNIHHLARYYRAAPDTVQGWLDDLDLSPKVLLRQKYNIGREQADLQLDAKELGPPGILLRAAEVLRELDAAPGGRRPWEDDP